MNSMKTKWVSKYTNLDGSLNIEYLKKHFPKRIAIELTNFCSHKCIHCPKSLGKKYPREIGHMKMSILKKIVDDFVSLNGEEIFFCQDGDACFSPILIDAVKYVVSKDKNMKITMVTNGAGLTENITEELLNIDADYNFVFDIYAARPETFTQITQTNLFEQCEKNIKNFIQTMKRKRKNYKPSVQILKHTTISNKEIRYFKHKWKKLGLTPGVSNLHPYPEMPLTELGVNEPKGRRYPCVQPFLAMNIFYDGNVTVCCLNYGALYVGNIKNQSLMDIWVGKKWNKIRQAHLENRLQGLICENCNVWYHQAKFFFESRTKLFYNNKIIIPLVAMKRQLLKLLKI